MARTFRLDPVAVLGGRAAADLLDVDNPDLAWSLRVAAHQVIMGDMEETSRGD